MCSSDLDLSGLRCGQVIINGQHYKLGVPPCPATYTPQSPDPYPLHATRTPSTIWNFFLQPQP